MDDIRLLAAKINVKFGQIFPAPLHLPKFTLPCVYLSSLPADTSKIYTMRIYPSFPLYCGGRLVRDVVDHPVNLVLHGVGDSCGYAFQNIVRDF